MRAVLQRVSHAAVAVDGETIGRIDNGILALVSVEHSDTQEDASYIAEKIASLRIFRDAEDKMNLSVGDVGGSVLVISQFTLHGDCRRGRRPSFITAAPPETAIPLYEQVIALLRNNAKLHVETGRFGAYMQVSLLNDGPVTILLDSKKQF
jgi:D-aminoacyl-tRNA deacylase